MQGRFGLGDLHLGGGERAAQCPFGDIAGEERLAGAILATNRLERGPAAGDRVQFCVQGGREPVQADGEQVQAAGGHGSPPQRVDDLAAAARGRLAVTT